MCRITAPVSQLKRLGGDGGDDLSKSTKEITYTAQLDLAEYMSGAGEDDPSDAQYTLYAVMVHQELSVGTTTGHYYAFVRLSDDRWYKCDDGEVTKVRSG